VLVGFPSLYMSVILLFADIELLLNKRLAVGSVWTEWHMLSPTKGRERARRVSIISNGHFVMSWCTNLRASKTQGITLISGRGLFPRNTRLWSHYLATQIS
jgi:hypothetical protein